MSHRALAVLVALTAATVFGVGVALTQGGLSRPVGLAGGETIVIGQERELSPAAVAGQWVVWVETQPGTEPPRADLVLFDMVGATYSRIPLIAAPDIDDNEPMGWLSGGPAADVCTVPVPAGSKTGPCVAFIGRSLGSDSIWAYSPGGLFFRQTPIPIGSGPSVSGSTVVWAEEAGGGTQIMTLDLRTSTGPTPLVTSPGVKRFPVISEGEQGAWLAWLEGDTDALTSALWVRDLQSGVDHLASVAALPAPLDAAGDRLLFTVPAGGEGGVTLMVYDVVRREGGGLVTRSAQACSGCAPEEFLRGAISDEIIVHQDEKFVRMPGTPPAPGLVPLIAHDARQIRSYANLASYLTGYTVASLFTDTAVPSASGSRVAWRDAPLSDSEDLIRTVHVARERLFIPFVWGP